MSVAKPGPSPVLPAGEGPEQPQHLMAGAMLMGFVHLEEPEGLPSSFPVVLSRRAASQPPGAFNN